MKIEDLISGRKDNETVVIQEHSIPVAALKGLLSEGYDFLRRYNTEKTFFAWGKTCSGCFTENQLIEKK